MLDYYDIIDLKMIVKNKVNKLEKRLEKQESLKMWEACNRVNSNLTKYQSILDKLNEIQVNTYENIGGK